MGRSNPEVGFCLITSQQMAKSQMFDIKVLMARTISRLVSLAGADVLFIFDDVAFQCLMDSIWNPSAPSKIVSALIITSN